MTTRLRRVLRVLKIMAIVVAAILVVFVLIGWRVLSRVTGDPHPVPHLAHGALLPDARPRWDDEAERVRVRLP